MTPFLELMLVLAIVLAGAKLAGWLMIKLNQPAVVGEIAFGLVLGPSVLDLMGSSLVTHAAATTETVHMLAELGVVMLMFIAGLETDLGAMREVGLPALSGAVGGVLLPFLGGWGLGVLVGMPTAEAVFVGTILTATSVSISAQTLLELKRLRSKEGMAILGAAVIDDVIGILMLSVVVATFGAAGGDAPPLWVVAIRMIAYFAVGVALAPLARRALAWFARLPLAEPLIAGAIVLVLVYSWSAEYLGGVAAITGAYLIGVLLAQSDLREKLEGGAKTVAYGLLVSVFFVDIGLRADLGAALRGGSIWLGVAIVAIAIVAKAVGAAGGARLAGFTNLQSLRFGAGMVSRGEVGLIVATIGMERGVIPADLFALIVLMVVVTTLVTPVLLRAAFAIRERETGRPVN